MSILKYEYKFFLDWDKPSAFHSFGFWFFDHWKFKGQIGGRFAGLYVNLMWRLKVNHERG